MNFIRDNIFDFVIFIYLYLLFKNTTHGLVIEVLTIGICFKHENLNISPLRCQIFTQNIFILKLIATC